MRLLVLLLFAMVAFGEHVPGMPWADGGTCGIDQGNGHLYGRLHELP